MNPQWIVESANGTPRNGTERQGVECGMGFWKRLFNLDLIWPDKPPGAATKVTPKGASRSAIFQRVTQLGSSSQVVGIDLGTACSKIAAFHDGRLKVIPNCYGEESTPSIVLLTNRGDFYVGRDARNHVRRHEHTSLLVGSIKRDILRKGGTIWNGTKRYPQALLALILSELKIQAERNMNRPVHDAVISVPASFGVAERRIIIDAARIAGLRPLRLLNEPTAAALTWVASREGKMFVYDLGGGTFDVSLVEVYRVEQEKTWGVEVLATKGNMELGGQDYDQRLLDFLADEIKKIHAFDVRKDGIALGRLREAAEQAKVDLSSQTEVQLEVPFFLGNTHLRYSLSRAKLEELTRELTAKTIKICEELLADAHLTAREIDGVLLAGGQTHMPQIQIALKLFFGERMVSGMVAEQAVAEGAAIQGAVLTGAIGHLQLLDVIPKSLGVEVEGGETAQLIKRGATFPVRKTKLFTTTRDNQASISCRILEGEDTVSAKNKCLGAICIDNILPAPAGTPQIEVVFYVDSNGVVSVTARDVGSGKERTIRAESSEALTDSEMARISNQVLEWQETRRETIKKNMLE